MAHHKGFVLHRRQRATAVTADDPVGTTSTKPSASTPTRNRTAGRGPSSSSTAARADPTSSTTSPHSPHSPGRSPATSNNGPSSSTPSGSTIPAVASPSSSGSSTAAGAANSGSQTSSVSTATILGIIIMAVAVLFLVVVVARKLKKRRKRDSAARAILQPYDEKLGQRTVSTSSHTPSQDRSSSPIPLAPLAANTEPSEPETPFDAFLKKQREEERTKKLQSSEWTFGDEARFTTSSTSGSLRALPALSPGNTSAPPSPGGQSVLVPQPTLEVPTTPNSAGSLGIAYERSETGSINAASGPGLSPTRPESAHVPVPRGAPGTEPTLAALIAQQPEPTASPATDVALPNPVVTKSFVDSDSAAASSRVTSTSSSAAPPPYIAASPSPASASAPPSAPVRTSGMLQKGSPATAEPRTTTRDTLTPAQAHDWSVGVRQLTADPRRTSRVPEEGGDLPYVL